MTTITHRHENVDLLDQHTNSCIVFCCCYILPCFAWTFWLEVVIISDLQGRLADYNTAIRIANGEATKQSVEEQTKELEANNKKLQEEVEQVFLEKQRKENQLRQLREQMDKVFDCYFQTNCLQRL